MMTLADIVIGEQVLIQQVRGRGALRRRLLEMGLTPNTTVSIRKMAPMGDPIELRVRGYSLTLRKEDANLIDVCDIHQGFNNNFVRGHRHQYQFRGNLDE